MLPKYPVKERLEKWKSDLREMGINDPETEKRLEGVVGDPWREKTICPVVSGDFNHDGNWYDLAVIVVDTTKQNPARLGVVIFNTQKDENAVFLPHWLYRDRDLSKVTLSAFRDGLIINEFGEDGSMVNHRIKWSPQESAYKDVGKWSPEENRDVTDERRKR
jgi:hypothetical protein